MAFVIVVIAVLVMAGVAAVLAVLSLLFTPATQAVCCWLHYWRPMVNTFRSSRIPIGPSQPIVPVTGYGVQSFFAVSAVADWQPKTATGKNIETDWPIIPTDMDDEHVDHTDQDFVSCLVEACVVDALGLLLPIRNVYQTKPGDAGYVCGDSIYVPKQHLSIVRSTINSLNSLGEGTVAYRNVVIDFTARSGGRLWACSQRFADPTATAPLREAASKVAERLSALAARTSLVVEAGAVINHRVLDARGGLQPEMRTPNGCDLYPTTIRGVPDLVLVKRDGASRTISMVVELKYVQALTDDHRRQAMCYARLLNARRALLINCRTGVYEAYALPSPQTMPTLGQLERAARAVQGVARARSAHNTHVARHENLVPLQMHGRSVILAVDVETIFPDNSTFGWPVVAEVGAVAVDAASLSILGTFHWLAPEVQPLVLNRDEQPNPRDVARLEQIRYQCVNPTAGAAAFKAWSTPWCERAVLLQYGGSDAKLLRLDDSMPMPSLNAHLIFRSWLQKRGEVNSGHTNFTGAEDALSQTVPQLSIAAHQAFDDAIAALAIVIAVTK